MEEMTLIRTLKTEVLTAGELWYDNQLLCYTLEDAERKVKIKHQTCIPVGVYKVIVNMSTRFKQNMPLLLNVPNFEGVRIHKGNTTEDTSGCILVGTKFIDNKLLYSSIAYTKVFSLIQKLTTEKGLQIVIKDKPEPQPVEKPVEKVSVLTTEPVSTPTPVTVLPKTGNKNTSFFLTILQLCKKLISYFRN